MPHICWEKHGKNDKFRIHFDGVPYIFLGNGDYQCHQGRDRNITKKQKCKETRKVLGRGIDHTQHIKRENYHNLQRDFISQSNSQ